MVRIGEDIVIVESDSGTIGIIGGREIGIGKRVISLPSDGVPIAVRHFNTYVGDDGVSIPLPCGSRVFIPAEPPNYLPPSWESGFGMSCQQGEPYTDGWKCADTCPIHPVMNPCPRGDNNGTVNDRNIWFCRNFTKPREYAYKYWQANVVLHPAVEHYTWECGPDCNFWNACGSWKYIRDIHIPAGCMRPAKRGVNTIVDSPAYYTYGCTGKAGTCPNYNDGKGIKRCPIGPDPAGTFPTQMKPSGCAHQTLLSFLGWVIPGGESSASASCVLAKATEGAANRSDGPIRCKFSYPTGEAELSGQGDLRLPISPTNLGGDGKAGTPLSTTATISISGSVDLDYRRTPARKTETGTARAFTQGRY